MKEMDFKLLTLEISRYAILVLLLYTGLHKIFDINFFEENLLKSNLLSDYTIYVKYPLPIVEIIICFLLFFDKTFLKGLYSSLFLLLSFTFYLIALNNFSFFYGCSCGGIFNEMDYVEHVFINIFFILINIISIYLYNDKYYKK